MIKLVLRLLEKLSLRRRLQLGMLLILIVCASMAEVISIGAVVPFLGILTAPENIFEHQLTQPLLKIANIQTPEELILPVTAAFACGSIAAGAVRLLLLWGSTRWSYAFGADLSLEIYQRTLYQPYSVHIGRNSSEVISGVSSKVYGVINRILQLLNFVGATVILAGILLALLLIGAEAALAATAGFGLVYMSTILLVRNRLSLNSREISEKSNAVIKILQEGLGGIREILLGGTQEIYIGHYRYADSALRAAQGSNAFLSSSPRYLVEAVGMLLIAAMAFVIAKERGGIQDAVPILGAIALGAQRMLPTMQLGYSAWVTLRGEADSMIDTIALLDQPMPDRCIDSYPNPMVFQKYIKLENISFRYSAESPWILRGLNLTINLGDRVGIVGQTGSGKSTLVDIIMGLLQPTEGRILIDGVEISSANQRQWQMCIAHVPQSIFLADSSVEESIAFGIKRELLDRARVRVAAEQAKIAATIEAWPLQYQTVVGERGVKLSGGQRQRIGIARALYKKTKIIVFDEATSALDSITEEAVMASIEKLNPELTVIMIAHRLTTLASCNKIYKLENSEVECTNHHA
jgi:ATP-binding cassette subfamily B protein